MGVGPFHYSASTYDKPEMVERVVEKIVEKKVVLPNPNPERFKIISWHQNGKFLILYINYPDCTNYEGNKILLYKGCCIEDLVGQGSVDPHFSNNKEKISPIARFVPTLEGWDMAVKLIEALQHGKVSHNRKNSQHSDASKRRSKRSSSG
jgi:hypothetical protein